MALTLQQIMDEATQLVPHSFTDADLFLWLNEVNNKFFEVVKIPLTESFTTVKGTSEYTLDSGIRERNIDKVHVGGSEYKSFTKDNVKPAHLYHTFNDTTHKITLSELPTRALMGIVKYFQIATSTYTTSDGNKNPDAPEEYHFIYVYGLAQKIAAAQEDLSKANNYETSFMNNLDIAAQNYKE